MKKKKARSSEHCQAINLPKEIIVHIFENLGSKDAKNLSITSKKFYEAYKTTTLYQIRNDFRKLIKTISSQNDNLKMIFCENTIGTIQQIKDDLDCRQYSCKIKEKANKFIQTEVKKKIQPKFEKILEKYKITNFFAECIGDYQYTYTGEIEFWYNDQIYEFEYNNTYYENEISWHENSSITLYNDGFDEDDIKDLFKKFKLKGCDLLTFAKFFMELVPIDFDVCWEDYTSYVNIKQ